jgi:protein TonB
VPSKRLLSAVLVVVASSAGGVFGGSGAVLGAQEVFESGNGVTLPEAVTKVSPQYTSEAMRAHIEGIVGLNVVVSADGAVAAVAVTRSLDSTFGLDQEAVKAMKQWKFKPGTKSGKAAAVRIDVDMTFTLK